MAGPTRIFRGGELPSLLFLAGIMVAGWTIFFTSCSPKAEPPRPGAVAQMPPLPPPDDALVFKSVTDKTLIKLGDMGAYAALLDRVRKTPPAQLTAQSRRDVIFSQLLERPERHRGLPIHLQGTAKRILIHDDIAPELSPKLRLYEAWVFTDDSQGFPYVLVFEDAPKGLPGGNDVNELIAFDGYFLKLMAYQAGDLYRFAPMLIGRVGWRPQAGKAAATTVLGLPRETLRAVVAVLFLFSTVRLLSWGFRARRGLIQPGARIRVPSPIDQIDPEDLSDWLARAPRSDPDPGDPALGDEEANARNGPGSFARPGT